MSSHKLSLSLPLLPALTDFFVKIMFPSASSASGNSHKFSKSPNNGMNRFGHISCDMFINTKHITNPSIF